MDLIGQTSLIGGGLPEGVLNDV